MANLVIFISKNGEKIPQNNKKMCVCVCVCLCVFLFFSIFGKKIAKLPKFAPNNSHCVSLLFQKKKGGKTFQGADELGRFKKQNTL